MITSLKKIIPLCYKKRLARLLRIVDVGHKDRQLLPWVVEEENPSSSNLLPKFRFFAIMGTWMEGDVIEATVKNAFTQGCERIYFIDNGSPDNTVDTAVKAGAILENSFSSESFDDRLKFKLMNDAVMRISKIENTDHIWWLWLDADEFPHGPSKLTLMEYLLTLDRSFRVVGARNFNHFPDTRPQYISGYHPLDFQSSDSP